jgi:6-pyruvoyltetrahydropterin/6-carboxytetrahydropterin synthase
MHYSSKTYGHEQGLSACFRQWKAQSHCAQLHGYALSVGLIFQAAILDSRNWVVDFGALKPLKVEIERLLDHRTIIAEDDPKLPMFRDMHDAGIINLLIMPAVGCEAFAQHIYDMTEDFLGEFYLPKLKEAGIKPPIRLAVTSVEVREHGANGAKYAPAVVRPLTASPSAILSGLAE